MAQRRMFSLKIVDTDNFLDMSPTAQLLYFHLAMRADDDGFVSSPKKISRMVTQGDDDMRVLIAKEFIIPFKSGVIVIKHWKENNYIQSDRKHNTIYSEEMALLSEDLNGVYKMDTESTQDVSKMDTEVRLGKVRLGKVMNTGTKVPMFIKPTFEELNQYCLQTGLVIDPNQFLDYYTANGWLVGKNKMKDWKATIRNWSRKDFNKATKDPLEQDGRQMITTMEQKFGAEVGMNAAMYEFKNKYGNEIYLKYQHLFPDV